MPASIAVGTDDDRMFIVASQRLKRSDAKLAFTRHRTLVQPQGQQDESYRRGVRNLA
ncbi:MAG: hypothetical protein IPL11_03790 [Candidatus Accumulibacter sp.]|nr:hypothetical protein [Accumulibacter sp.]